MPKHHSEDYKISAVKHYLKKSKNLTQTCEIFECSRISLKRWVERYLKNNEIKRRNRKPVSYKIAKNAIEQTERPAYLCRENQSGVLHGSSKSKSTRSAKGKPCKRQNDVHFKSSRV